MDVTEYYKRGWAEVQQELAGWLVFYGVFIAITMFTCGLGGLLMPNVMREIRDTHREQRAPDIGRLFVMDHLVDDIVNWLIYFGAISIGGAAGGIGGTLAAVALQFQMPLAAEGRYQPIDNAKLSLKHVGQHVGDHVMFMVIASVLGIVSVFFCLLPLIIIGPVIGKAHWLWYEDARAELDGFAADMGIKQLGGPSVQA